MNHNEVLKVTTGARNVGQELTSACLAMGHKIVDAVKEDDKTILYVQKNR